MQADDYIIEKLGIESYDDERKALILDQVRTYIGEAISKTLSAQQLHQYQEIIDANDAVIQPWLEKNIPNYKENPVYQQLEAGREDDPEQNDPAKIFAGLAWVEVNVPNVKEITDEVLDAFKKHRATVS